MATLLDPARFGSLSLKNRMVMAPLTRCRAEAGRVPGALMVEYYRQRAGAGMILSEATAVCPMGVGYPDTPGLWSKEQVEGWKAVTAAVHERGGLIVAQLWHVGRISDPIYLDGKLPVAPSAIAPEGHVSLIRPFKAFVTPRALEESEIPGIVEDYRKATLNALEAGFDGVELHGANGYLPHQFLHSDSNTRQDGYGGSIPKRARFMLEILDALISVAGADRVGLHLSPRCGVHSISGADAQEVYEHLAREVSKRGLAFIFARESQKDPRLLPMIRKISGIPVIANEELTQESGERLLNAGEVEAIGYGRLFIANPDLPERFARKAPLTPPDPNTFMGKGPKGYTDYPTL